MYAVADPGNLPQVLNGPEWSSVLFQIYFSGWLTISAIILLPLLIAILTETYKGIHQRSDFEWKFGRAKLISDMIKMPAAPAPINLLVRPYLYMRSVAKHGGLMCTKYASYYAAEDENEGTEDVLDNVDAGYSRLQGGLASYICPLKLHFFYFFISCIARRLSEGPDNIENVVDWSVVVRRYRATLKGAVDDATTQLGADDDANNEQMQQQNKSEEIAEHNA